MEHLLWPANLIPSKGDEHKAATTVIKSIHDVSACSEMLQSRLFIAYSWSKHFSRASRKILITHFTTSISSHPIQTHLPTALKMLRHETCKLKHLQDVGIYTEVGN